MAEIARHISVTGRVQGVFFRTWTKEHAEALAVRGWVRNRPDGHVEAHLEGDEAAVERMIEKLRCGPPAAEVENLRSWDADVCDFENFEVRR